MTQKQDPIYDLREFDADAYSLETESALSAAYYFVSLAESASQAMQMGRDVGTLLQRAAMWGAIEIEPFTIRDDRLVVVAYRGYEPVGISVLDVAVDTVRDVVTWVEPDYPEWIRRVLKIELLRNAHEAKIERVVVREGTTTIALYESLQLRAIPVMT